MRRFDDRSTAAWPMGAFHTLVGANRRRKCSAGVAARTEVIEHAPRSTTASATRVRTPLTQTLSADALRAPSLEWVITGMRRRGRSRADVRATRARIGGVPQREPRR